MFLCFAIFYITVILDGFPMQTNMQQLINISHKYGQDPDYVIAGGGNTSYKDEEKMWIKASGVSMSDIDENGFVCLERGKLEVISSKHYSSSVSEREQQVKEDLHSAILDSVDKRPSVETSMHEIIQFPFVVHTHPTLVNGLLCARDSEDIVVKLFGDEVLYLEYTDPGYVLFKAVDVGLKNFRAKKGKEPHIIFLENHGVFVGADTTDQIDTIYSDIIDKLRSATTELPDNNQKKDTFALETTMRSIADIYKELSFFVIPSADELSKMYTTSRKSFEPVSKPFTPDNIVYCKSNYLFIENECDLKDEFENFRNKHGYSPKIVGIQGKGILALEISARSAYIVLDVFKDMMKVSYLTGNFGGPRPMTQQQIDFIDNWEVENYRRKVSSED